MEHEDLFGRSVLAAAARRVSSSSSSSAFRTLTTEDEDEGPGRWLTTFRSAFSKQSRSTLISTPEQDMAATQVGLRRVIGATVVHEDHVRIVWLPTYSPELNLIEGLWGYLKRSAMNNYFYGDVETMARAIHVAFRELQQHPETALSLAYKTSQDLRKTA